MIKSGQKMLILFTFLFFVYFLKGLLNPGKLIKVNSPSQAMAKSAVSQNWITLNEKNRYATFFRVGGSINFYFTFLLFSDEFSLLLWFFFCYVFFVFLTNKNHVGNSTLTKMEKQLGNPLQVLMLNKVDSWVYEFDSRIAKFCSKDIKLKTMESLTTHNTCL